MGWRSISKLGEELDEEHHGRPVAAGEEGTLAVIAQEDFGRKVAVDLINGIVVIDYETLGMQNGTIELSTNPKTLFFHICDETSIVGELFGLEKTEPDKEGWYENKFIPIIFRPIWFSRVTNGVHTKIVGAQATLPSEYGSHNVKKMVMIFANGAIGID